MFKLIFLAFIALSGYVFFKEFFRKKSQVKLTDDLADVDQKLHNVGIKERIAEKQAEVKQREDALAEPKTTVEKTEDSK